MTDETEVVEGVEEQPEQEAPDSARDITERAFEALEKGGEAPEEQPAEDEGAVPGRTRDESGRFAKEKSAPRGKAEKPTPTRANAAGPEAGVVAPPTAAPASPVSQQKSPHWLKPAIREKWGTLPQDVRDEFMRLQGEAARTRQDFAQASKDVQGYKSFQEQIRPYEAQIRAVGQEPAQYVGELLKTAHALTYGGPQDKADRLADIVMQFGPQLLQADRVDANGVPSCPLDRALVARMDGRGRQMPQGQPQAQPQQFRDPRFDQFLDGLQKQQAAREQQEAAEVDSSLSNFAEAHPFYEDVAPMMASVLEAWGKDGVIKGPHVLEQDLERAYHVACMASPDVAPVYEQRRAAEAAQKARATAQRARTAAVSLRSSAAPESPRPSGKLSARQVTERAWDDLSGRV